MPRTAGAEGSAPEGAGTQVIYIHVKAQADHPPVQFKAQPNMKMQKLMDAYCKRHGEDQASLRFLYEGRRISPDETALDLELKDGDYIDVFYEQLAGSLIRQQQAE